MHLLQSGKKSFPLIHNPRSIEYQNNPAKIVKEIDLKEHGKHSNHTKEKKCDVKICNYRACNEPISRSTFKYRHQHQQHILKHLKHIIQRCSSRYTLASQSSISKSSSPSNISATIIFHLIFLSKQRWNKKSNKSSQQRQPKTKFSTTSRSRSSIGQFYHQNKNSAEKPAGKLLRWSSSNRGGSIEKKQFDREYRFLRNSYSIKRKFQHQQQQQQRTKQNKHIEFLLYNAFVKNSLTARKY